MPENILMDMELISTFADTELVSQNIYEYYICMSVCACVYVYDEFELYECSLTSVVAVTFLVPPSSINWYRHKLGAE